MVKIVKFINDKSNVHAGDMMAEKIDLSPLLDDGLLLSTIFRYSTVEDLTHLRRASSCFHPQIQPFWYRFNPRQQMYYLTQYTLEILAKKHRPFQLQQIKQALRDGGLVIGVDSFEVSQTVAWIFSGLLLDAEDYPLPQTKNPFLSAMLNLFRHQYRGNDTLCQNSYHKALKHIGSMNLLMEPLLKSLVLSTTYRPGDLLNSFWHQLKQDKPNKKNLFQHLEVIVANCGEKHLPGVIKALLPCFKDKDKQIRWAAVRAWVKIPKYYPSYAKRAWAKPLYCRLIDKTLYISPVAINVSDKIAAYCDKQQFSILLTAFFSLFDNKDIGPIAIYASVKLVKYCDRQQFTLLMEALQLRLKDKRVDKCRAAIRAWIEITKDSPKFEWREGVKPLFLLFTAKKKHVRQVIVQESIKLAKICNKRQFANLLIELSACFRDKDPDVRKAAIQSWIELANGYPNDQCEDWRKPLSLWLAEKDDFVCWHLVECFPEVVKYCDEKRVENLIIKELLKSKRLRMEEDIVRISGDIAMHYKEKQFSSLLQLLFLYAKDKDHRTCSNAILMLGGMAKHCEKRQFVSMITVLFSLIIDGDLKEYDSDENESEDEDDENWIKTHRREGAVWVAGETVKYCDKKQRADLIDLVLPRLKDHSVNVRESACKAVGDIVKCGDKERAVELVTALISCPLDGYDRMCEACDDALEMITVSCCETRSKGNFGAFNYYLDREGHQGDRPLSVQKAVVQILAGKTKSCDRKLFLPLIATLLSDLKDGHYMNDHAALALGAVLKRASSLQRKEITRLLVEGEGFAKQVIPIMQDIVLLDRLSGVKTDKALYQQLLKLNMIQKTPSVKQEKQDDFKTTLDDLKKDNERIATKKEAETLYDDLLSRSVALATIENQQVFLMSFFLLKLEAFVAFSKLSSSPSERKAIKKKAKMCATFFCRHHTKSMIIQVSKTLPHQPFTCPKSIKTVINGYLPRRVYGLRKRIRPNPRYSTKPSVTRAALFSQSNKKRKARTTEPDKQLKVTAKRPRQ
jgi:hypothetical protein